MQIWLDADGDGKISSGDTLLGTGTYTSNDGTINFTINVSMAGGSNVNVLVVVNYSVTAPTGTYQTAVDPGGISCTNAAGPVQISGLPVTGAVVNLTHDTGTSTYTPTSGNVSPIIYPNPSTGLGQVQVYVPWLTKTSDVKVQIFTASFRKVKETIFPKVLPGVGVTLTLTDQGNTPLANGLYYIVVTTAQGRGVAKLLIIR